MKRILLLLLFAPTLCPAQGIINLKVSKPLCLITFLQAAHGDANLSHTLISYIHKNIAGEDSAAFYKLADEFAALSLDNSYTFPYYPQCRQKPHTTLNLILIQSVQSSDVNDFMQRIIGILPNAEWLKLKQVVAAAEPYYDKMIARPFEREIGHQLAELEQYRTKADDIFTKMKTFYGSTWSSDIPFTVSIYPVPGRGGNTTATPHSNSIVLAVLTRETDYARRMSVAIHEMGHVLYEEQSLAMELQIDSLYGTSKSLYAQYAYNFLDEALATATGNGWAYEMLSGTPDTTEWYNDPYINGFGHAIYPLVKEYIIAGKAIDREFIAQSIRLFEKTFPGAIYNYHNLLSRVNIYTDAKDREQFQYIGNTLMSTFTISSSGSSYPIADPQSQSLMGSTSGTQLIIVHTDHDKNFRILKSKFPQLKNIAPHTEGITSFYDAKKRPIIIVNVKDASRLKPAIAQMNKVGAMNPDKMFMPME